MFRMFHLYESLRCRWRYKGLTHNLELKESLSLMVRCVFIFVQLEVIPLIEIFIIVYRAH